MYSDNIQSVNGTSTPGAATGGPQRSEDTPVAAPGAGACAGPDSGALDSTQSKCCHTPVTCDDADDLLGTDSRSRRRLRWNARAALWTASSLKAVRCCGRLMGHGVYDDQDYASVPIKKSGDSAGYGNLATCGSVWSCPRCSAVIAMQRSVEIGRAVKACQEAAGSVLLMTVTLRHNAGDELGDLWEGLSSGWRRMFGSVAWTGRSARQWTDKQGRERHAKEKVGEKSLFQACGTTRAIECTYGRPRLGGQGWHLHAHVLVFLACPLVDLVDREAVRRLLHVDTVTDEVVSVVASAMIAMGLFDRWCTGVVKAGLERPEGQGFDLREIKDGGAEFIGGYLSKSTLDVAARVGAEIGGGRNTKQTRLDRNVTPFELLDDLTRREDAPRLGFRTPRHWTWMELPEGGFAVVDLDTGEVTEFMSAGEWPRWHAWEQASKGRRQILWSQRVKEPVTAREELWNTILDARGQEETDEEIADREVDGAVVAEISRAGWYQAMVWHPSWLTELLEVVEDAASDEAAGVDAVLWGRAHAVDIRPAKDAKAAAERRCSR